VTVTLLALGVGALAAGVFGVLLLDLTVRRADLGAAFVLAAMVLQAAYVEEVPSVSPAGVRIGVTDALFVFVVGAGIARLLRIQRYGTLLRWLLLLGVVALVSLLRGIAAYGVQPAVNDFRQYLQFVGAAAYFATFPPTPRVRHRIGLVFLAFTIPMMVLVCLRWLATFGGVDLGPLSATYDAAIRAVNGPETFFFALAAMLTLPAWQQPGRQARRIRWLGVVLLLFVTILDRRTVWLTMVAGAAVLALHDPRLGRRALSFGAVAALATAMLFAAFSSTGTSKEPLAQSADNTATLTWRVEGWSELLAAWSENPANWFVGQSFGSGFQRKVDGSEVDSHPHDFYIETMLRTGIVGLAALLVLLVGLPRALWRRPGPDRGPTSGPRPGAGSGGDFLLAPKLFPALLVMQVIWCVTWIPGVEQGILTGLAVALAAARPQRQPARAAPRQSTTAPLPARTGAAR